MDLSKEQSNFLDSLLEAGAVAAHDFSGQVHVIQFCGEEIADHISEDGVKYLERMNKSIENLASYVKSFRDFLKVHKIPGAEDSLTFGTAHLWNQKTLDIHYMKKIDLQDTVDILFPEELESLEIHKNEFEFLSMTFSLYALLIDNYRKLGGPKAKLSLSLNKVDQNLTLISMEDEDNQLSEEQFLAFLDADLVGSKKSSRRVYGNQLIKDAINGESKLFKLELKCSQGIGIYLQII
jgi:hypothetical protein